MNLSVLRTYRAQLEETLRVELAELQRAVEQELAARRRFEEECEADACRFLAQASEGMTVDEAFMRQVRLDALTDSIRQAHEAVEEAQRRWDRKLAEVMDASRETKKIEILEKREALSQRQREKRREQGALDEAAGRRFLSNGGRKHG